MANPVDLAVKVFYPETYETTLVPAVSKPAGHHRNGELKMAAHKSRKRVTTMTKRLPVKKQTPIVVAVVDAPVVFEPRVYASHGGHSTILVHRNEDTMYHIPMDEELHVRRSDFIQFRSEYSPTEYPVGLAAYRFINPVLGGSPIIGTTARIILEIVMKTYLVRVKSGEFIGSFANEKAAATATEGKKGLLAVTSEKQLSELPNKELQSISLLIGNKTKVTDEEKKATAKAIWAVLKKAKAELATEKPGKAKNADSKMEKAYAIFTEQYGESQRSDIIQSFRDDVKLTEGGAPTYYYLCLKRMEKEYTAAGKTMPEGVAKSKAGKAAAKGNGAAAKAPKGGKKGAKKAAKKGAKRTAAKSAASEEMGASEEVAE